MADLQVALKQKLVQQLEVIYEDVTINRAFETLAVELLKLMRLDKEIEHPKPYSNNWDENDVILITYGDSVITEGEKPLNTLKTFMDQCLGDTVNSVHILPFFPYSSDDGFAVIDYSSVNESLGGWQDISDIAKDRRLMSDLVINHCSSRSAWFQNFIRGEGTGSDYFFTACPEDDLSNVVRPRTSPLLRETETKKGIKHVWCTFSHDQVDFDFRNPEVLKAFVKIIRQYMDAGLSLIHI